MLESAVLAIAFTYAWHPGPHATKANDVAFMAAVEQSIQLEPKTKPPQPFAGDIELLGDAQYKVRNDAYNRLLKASQKNPRWLFWGLKHSDIEVRLWCNKALWSLSECYGCRGTGICEFEPALYAGEPCGFCGKCTRLKIAHEGNNPTKCRECNGWRRFWNYGVKDDPVLKEPKKLQVIQEENPEQNHEGAPWGN